MKNKCLTCGKNCEGVYCFNHKPRKPIPKSNKVVKKLNNPQNVYNMREFFLQIWNKKTHKCENCGKWLGNEPLSYMFDHLLEKSKYPDLKYEENNIMLVCLECHDSKTRGFLTETVRSKIEAIKKLFNK